MPSIRRRKDTNPWKTLAAKRVYQNRWFSVREDKVLRPDGKLGKYFYLKLADVAAVVPRDAQGNVALVQQWRYVQGARQLEVVSGCLESLHENPLRAAKRELQEETGLTAKRWTKLGGYYQANATRIIHCYLAQGLTQGKNNLDGTEDITVHWYPWKKALALLQDGTVTHGATTIALLRADQYLRTHQKRNV